MLSEYYLVNFSRGHGKSNCNNGKRMFNLHMVNELLYRVKSVIMARHTHAWTTPLVISRTVEFFKLLFYVLKALSKRLGLHFY